MINKILRLIRSLPIIIKARNINVRIGLFSEFTIEGNLVVKKYFYISNYSTINVHKNSSININGFTARPNVKINVSGGNLTIGKNTYLESFSTILCKGDITIGNNIAIASNVVIVDYNHVITNKTKNYTREADEIGKIIIKDNVWISAGVKILKNVTIGEGAIIGANAVVTKDVPAGKIYGGIPAKAIR